MVYSRPSGRLFLFFHQKICVFQIFVVPLQRKCENILIIEIFAFGLHE